MEKKKSALTDKKMLLRAVKDSFVKLAPKTQVKNPVMMLVYVSAVHDDHSLPDLAYAVFRMPLPALPWPSQLFCGLP